MLAALATASGCAGNNPPVAPIVIPPLDSIRVTPDTLRVRVGATAAFTVVGYDTLGAPISGVPATWTSNDSTHIIVTVDSRGRVTGVSEGAARVYAEYLGLRDSAVVVVEPAQDGWYVQASNANGADLHGVFFQPDGRNGCAVGDAGKILITNSGGAQWTAQVSGTAFALEGVWFTSATQGWAVGAGGTVLHTGNGGSTWTRLNNTGTLVTLTDVSFSSTLVGSISGAGLVLTTDDGGVTWSQNHPTTAALNGISMSGANGWAVGDAGTIVGTHDFGTTWFVVQPFVTVQTLRSVWTRSATKAFAAGGPGVTPRTVQVPVVANPDTTGWELRSAGASNVLDGVCFPTDLLGYAVGTQGVGVVLRTDDGGITWNNQTSNAQFALEDVFFVDTQRGWAVGANGLIIHTGTGGE